MPGQKDGRRRGGLRPPPRREDSGTRFTNLETGRAVGVGITQDQVISTIGLAAWPAKLALWRSYGIRIVSVNRPITASAADYGQMIRDCYNAGILFWQRGLDDGPASMEGLAIVGGGIYADIKAAYGASDARARMHIANLVKAIPDAEGMAALASAVTAFWAIAAPYSDGVVLSLGNEPENWYQHVFRGNRTPPFSGGAETGTLDSSDYGGFMQITDEGQVSPVPATARSTFETAYGSAAPNDATIRANIAASNATLRTYWPGQFYDGPNNHGYYQDTGGTYYWGETGDDTNVAVYSEFGVPQTIANVDQIEVLAKPPSSARILIYWPDGSPLDVLADEPYRTVVTAKANALGLS